MTMTDAPPATDPDPTPKRRSRWILPLGAVVLVAGGVVAYLILTDDDDEPSSSPPVTSELPDPFEGASDPDAVELGELLDAGSAATYHARYLLAGGSTDAPAPDVELEVWRDGERLRQDTSTEVEGQAVQTASFVDDGRIVLCSRSGELDWSCAESAPSGTEQDGVIGSVLDQLAGSDLTPRDDEIDGRAVRCFAFTSADGDGDVCVTPEGVPARVHLGGAGIELSELDDDVPGDVFDPPAEPVQTDTTEG
jgi:hypothetical protein